MSISFYSLAGKKINKWKLLYKKTLLVHFKSSSLNTLVENKKSLITDSNEYHCLQIVKKSDYENFLATLLIDSHELRRTAFSLRALNVELSQIRDLTKSDHMAQFRFQFWSDTIDNIFKHKQAFSDNSKQIDNFPVAQELQTVLLSSDLSKHWITKMIEVRRDSVYLSDFPFKNLEELEKYCESSFASLYYLLNQKIIELSPDKSAGHRISLDHIANHLGKAQGLTNILRGVKHNASFRRCYIPNDILVNNKCSHEDFLRGNINEFTCNAIFELASQANSHLEHSIKLLKDLQQTTRTERLAFLSYLPIQIYLDSLQKCNFNIFNDKLYRKNGYLPLKMWWKAKFI